MTKPAGVTLYRQAGCSRLANEISNHFVGDQLGPVTDGYNSPAVKTIFSSGQTFIQRLRAYLNLHCLAWTKPIKVHGVDLLSCCEYKLANSGMDQTAGLRPCRSRGLGSLSNEP